MGMILDLLKSKISFSEIKLRTKTLDKKKRKMNKYPIRRFPLVVRDALTKRIINDGYVSELPHSVMIRSDKTFCHYLPHRLLSTAFTLDINVRTKESVFSIGEYEGRYASRPFDRERPVPMEKDHVVIKGYISTVVNTNRMVDVEAIFHPSQMPKSFPEIQLNERERRILFCFGSLKEGFMRREALLRLDVSKPEIEALVTKGVLRKIGGGHAITLLGEASKLPRPHPNGEKVAVDQW